MIAGGFKVKRGACCRCGATGRHLYTLQIEPEHQPWLKGATLGNPDAAACSECWEEVADIITSRFTVAAG